MDLAELEQEAAQHLPATVTKDAEPVHGYDDQLLIDLQDGLILLHKCRNMANYLADTDLCKALSKKERDTLHKLSEKIKDYLEQVEYSYGEEV